jgi:hypothetical protein
MNMFKPVGAKSAKEYISKLPTDRKKAITELDKMLRKIPSFKPWFAYNMLGYGVFKYKNHKKEVVAWPVVSLASQKNYMSLYVCSIEEGKYLAEKYKRDLGKVSVGRSCIRFKKLEDLNLPALKKLLTRAAKNPGLIK